MKSGKIIFTLLLSTIILFGCKSKKIVTESIVSASKNETVVLVEAAQPHYTTANISKMDISLRSEKKNISSPATCRIYRDSVIHLSILPFMGIEVFRLELSKNKVLAIDKINAVYYEMTYAEMASLLGFSFSFYDIQAAITNQLFCIGENGQIKQVKVSSTHGSEKEIRFETPHLTQKTIVDKEYLIQELELKSKEDNVRFGIEYDNFQAVTGIKSPQKLTIKIEKEKQSAACEFSVSRVVFDKEIKVSPTFTERYTKASINELLNLFN